MYYMIDSFDPKDSKTTGYHLFLIPPQELCGELQGVISQLAQEYQSISFVPHVTVLARIQEGSETDLIGKTERLAELLEPLQISLSEVCTEDAYYRALYLKAEEHEALHTAHSQALSMFGMKDSVLYTPHLSLYYGNTSVESKEKMIESLSLSIPIRFRADHLYLYKTEGEAHQWKLVHQSKLAG